MGRLLRHPADRDILRLAVPAFFALVAEPLYLLTDSAIVGHLGTPQLAGLGIAGAVLTTIVSLCVFLAYGTTAAVARRIGAGDARGALQQGIDGMWLAVGIGAAAAVLGLLGASAVVDALGASPAVAPYALIYLRISVLGVPAMLVALAATGVLRGLQDTRTPLVIAVAGYAANVALNLLLVYGAGLGIAGSAWGTVLAQLGAAVAYVAVVGRAARRQGASWRPDRAGIRASAVAGVPLLVRTVTLRAALLLTTYVAAKQGDVALAAHQIAFNLWMLLALALDAIAIAAQALVGRALGAGDVAGTRATTRRMLGWGVASGVLIGVPLVVLRPLYDGLFTPDAAVQQQLGAVVLVVALLQLIAGPVFVLDGVLIGAGDGRYLAVAGIFTLVAYVPLAAVVVATSSGLVALWWAFGGFMLARLVTLLVRERSDAWLVTGPPRLTSPAVSVRLLSVVSARAFCAGHRPSRRFHVAIAHRARRRACHRCRHARADRRGAASLRRADALRRAARSSRRRRSDCRCCRCYRCCRRRRGRRRTGCG
jgi:putative MATE family efflux protein